MFAGLTALCGGGEAGPDGDAECGDRGDAHAATSSSIAVPIQNGRMHVHITAIGS